MSTMPLLAGTVSRYMQFYEKYAVQKWNMLTPMQYGTLLILVCVVGWILMKNARR